MKKSTEHQLMLEAAKTCLLAVQMVYDAASGHPGGSLSCLDVLTTLYCDVMNIDPQNPKDPNRDRFVMSKVTVHRHFIRYWHCVAFSPLKN